MNKKHRKILRQIFQNPAQAGIVWRDSYMGHVEFDSDAEIFHGEVINTRDVITFQGKTVSEIKKSFRESIDDYLNFCKERGEQPDKPFSGKFNLRLEPELHRKVYIAAKQHKISLNHWIENAIRHHIQE